MRERRNILEGKLPPPIGTSDWPTFSQDCYCVDKTLLIKDLVDRRTHVALFTRPRRFGKTSALLMLRAFFEKTSVDTSHLFADKKIWAAGEKYRALQGKFPVIYLTFKDHKWLTWEQAAGKLVRDVASEVGRHRAAVFAEWGEKEVRDQLQRVLARTATVDEAAEALGLLTRAVHAYTGVKPILLIDEYDTPISTASAQGYYEQMVTFMRVFLSGALKDCAHVEMAVLTGILRVAKEGLFSGLNNLSVWTVFDPEFSEHFGFTEDEVRAMADYYGVPEKMEEVRAWYDGYDFGGTDIYNPWSVLNYFSRSCRPKAYWLDTSSNDLIAELVQTYPHDLKETLESLLRGEAAAVTMAEELGPYHDVLKRRDTLYALLVSAGYLKAVRQLEDGRWVVQIPNREISQVFISDIRAKLDGALPRQSDAIADALLARDPVALQKAIAAFLRESVSYFDTAAEGFFHGLTLGFLAILRDRFRVDSNAESGDVRFDVALTPMGDLYPGFVIEVKAANAETDDLDALAQTALAQIDAKDYAAKMSAELATRGKGQVVVKIGLAYFKKRIALAQG